jgi:hypothetical protein
MIDTLKLSKRLQEASLPKNQAEAVAEGLAEALKENFVTNVELQKLRVELIFWIIGTQVLATGVVLGAMKFFFEHYKP